MDYGGDSGGECGKKNFGGKKITGKGVPYMKRFAMPNNGIWYSVDYPLVHIVVTPWA